MCPHHLQGHLGKELLLQLALAPPLPEQLWEQPQGFTRPSHTKTIKAEELRPLGRSPDNNHNQAVSSQAHEGKPRGARAP